VVLVDMADRRQRVTRIETVGELAQPDQSPSSSNRLAG
jgi:hypothetical protein